MMNWEAFEGIEEKRVHDCPNCAGETDIDYRETGRGWQEVVELCTDDDCEWEAVLGTIEEVFHG